MSEAMRVDITGLRDCGPALASLAWAVDETRRRLADRLDAEGACWGGDETGLAFHRRYGPAAAAVTQALSGLGDGVTTVGRSLVQAADNAEAAEDRAGHRFG